MSSPEYAAWYTGVATTRASAPATASMASAISGSELSAASNGPGGNSRTGRVRTVCPAASSRRLTWDGTACVLDTAWGLERVCQS